jgi:N utilization substance protein A
VSIKLGASEMQYIALFEGLTGTRVHDCVVNDEKLIFVVTQGDMGKALGKNGSKIRRAKQIIGKNIKVVEYFDDSAEFVKNLFDPANVESVKVVEKEGKKIAIVRAAEGRKAFVMGRGKEKINSAKKIALRQHDIQDIWVA